jgi:hypothetical protein
MGLEVLQAIVAPAVMASVPTLVAPVTGVLGSPILAATVVGAVAVAVSLRVLSLAVV